jgi:predicted nucleotidyltransferase
VQQNENVVTLDTLQGEKRAAILAIGEKHGARTIRVFGSVARGDNVETSDVNFPVEFEKGRTLFDLIGLRLDLRDLPGVEADIVTPNSLRSLRDRVLAEARAISLPRAGAGAASRGSGCQRPLRWGHARRLIGGGLAFLRAFDELIEQRSQAAGILGLHDEAVPVSVF